MQQLVLAALVVLAITAAVYVGVRAASAEGSDSRSARVGVAIGTGLTGAFAVLILQLDLIPDVVEPITMPALVVAITALSAGVAWRQLRRS